MDDGGARSTSAAPALAGFVGLGLFWGAFASLLPTIQRSTGASTAQLGVALLFISVGSLPAMLAAGRAVDRFGSRVASVSCAGFALATLLPGLANSVPALAAALVAAGAGSGALDVAVNARVARLEEERERRLMPLAHGLYSVGVVVGAVSAGVALGAGARPVWILVAVAAALAAVAVANASAGSAGDGVAGPRLRVDRALLVVGLVAAVAFVVEGGLESWSAVYLDRELDASPAVAGLGPGFFAAAMAAGRFAGQAAGGISDRTLLSVGAAAAAAGAILAASAHAVPVALAGFALGGGGISLAAPILFGAAGRGREHTGSAVATVTTLGYLGFLFGPPLMGGVSGAAGLRAGLLMLAAFAFTVAVGARTLPQERPRPAITPRG
jgi:MFS family permease